MIVMQKSNIGKFLLIILLLCSSSCYRTHYLSEPESGIYLLADYKDTIDHWIKHDEIHKNLICLADSYALFQSWEVRQAYLDAVRDKKVPSPEFIEILRERQVKQHENGNEFYLGLYCYDEDWFDLTGQDPVWRMTLSNDSGDIVRPIIIEEMVIPSDQAWAFLDFMTAGRKVYRVVFPKNNENGDIILSSTTKWFSLDCHSFLGRLSMKWKLGPVPAKLQ